MNFKNLKPATNFRAICPCAPRDQGYVAQTLLAGKKDYGSVAEAIDTTKSESRGII